MVMVVVFDLAYWSNDWFVFGLKEKVPERGPYCFIEISAQRVIAKKLNSDRRMPDERAQIPGKLRAEEKIAGEPTEKNGLCGARMTAELLQQVEESPIRYHAGKGDKKNVGQQGQTVTGPRVD